MEWIDAKKEFPPLEEQVLGYYTLPKSDKKKETEFYEYYVICSAESIAIFKDSQYASWRDTEGNAVKPLYWQHLPKPPTP